MNYQTLLGRRRLLRATAAAIAIPPASLWAADAVTRPKPSRISRHGSGRATGYAEANKIVTLGDQTHVAWLDSPPEGFRVRVRTHNRRTDQWSPTHTVGAAHDNHGGPALTVDSQGFLHIVYYPHHHAMRYRKSLRPGDASVWSEEVSFGERLTYPTLLCGSDDRLYLTARRSYRDRPWEVELWTGSSGDGWSRERSILASRYPGYAHFQESLCWGPDQRTLHLCCRFHEKSDGGAYGRLQAVGYLRSGDGGKSWQRGDGTNVSLPATAESADVLISGGVDRERVLRAGALAVDDRDRPYLVYSVQEGDRSQLFLAHADGHGSWQRTGLNRFLPKELESWRLLAPAGISFTSNGRIVVTAQLQRPDLEGSSWGHPSSEVVAFDAAAGSQDFRFQMISPRDAERAHWLPNIERATGHNVVPERPGIIYTAGGAGSANTQLLANEVYFARSEV